MDTAYWWLWEFSQALRWPWFARGKPGCLADPHVQAFHRDVAAAFARRDALALYGLHLDDRMIACLYGLEDRQTLYYYLGGFDPAAGWTRDPSTHISIISGPVAGTPTMHGLLVADVTIDGVTIVSPDAVAPGDSSIAALLTDSLRIVFSGCTIVPGSGAAGTL